MAPYFLLQVEEGSEVLVEEASPVITFRGFRPLGDFSQPLMNYEDFNIWVSRIIFYLRDLFNRRIFLRRRAEMADIVVDEVGQLRFLAPFLFSSNWPPYDEEMAARGDFIGVLAELAAHFMHISPEQDGDGWSRTIDHLNAMAEVWSVRDLDIEPGFIPL